MCVYCQGLSDNFQNIKDFYGIDKKITLFETENFTIIPNKFPISNNHILILPKHHMTMFVEFGKKEQAEIRTILERLKYTTKSKTSVLFEHGTSKIAANNTAPNIKSIFHAHLHFMPDTKCTTTCMQTFFKSKGVSIVNDNDQPQNLSKFQTAHNKNIIDFLQANVTSSQEYGLESYLYIKNSDDTQLFFPDKFMKPTLPSQFLCEALSERCGTTEWDWKVPLSPDGKNLFRNRIIQTIDLFNACQ
jgi:diadenosine tetraphosphate (Ap4A) HIT family hydrolase